jgi:GntR family transcriptional repressor for pyruvate dehydrogenase complex
MAAGDAVGHPGDDQLSDASVTLLLRPVVGGRISEEIVAQIIALIRTGQLRPGDRLPPERDLAQHFGVSRVTVRDALRVLEGRGLVEIRMGARGGAFVTVPSTELVSEGLRDLVTMTALSPEDVVEARLIMELGIVDLVLANATDADLAGLRELCATAQEAVERGQYDTELSTEFHARLAAATHNEAVAKLSETFRGPLRLALVRAREGKEEGAQVAHRRSVDDHVAILDALNRRDRAAVRRRLADHLVRATNLQDIAEQLLETPPPDTA